MSPTRSHRQRRALAAAGTLSLAVLLVALMLRVLAPTSADAATQNDATVVVQFDDSARVARAITFTDPISGLRGLALSGLDVVTASFSFGDAVCSIEGVGCPATNCFCNTSYWGYSYWDGAAWVGYSVGAGSSVISQTGAVEGWRWGEFGSTTEPFTPTQQALDALTWLHAQQTLTGSFGSLAASVESQIAFGANREDAADVRRAPGGTSLESFVALGGGQYSRAAAGAAGKIAAAGTASAACLPAGAVLPSFHYSNTLGAYSDSAGANAWALLGALAVSDTVPAAAMPSLLAQQLDSGAWEWSPGFGDDTNTTALALQALVAAGTPVSATSVISALAWLEEVQSADGGFPYAAGAGAQSDVNSTAYVMQALWAAAENPGAARWTQSGGSNPLNYLQTMQLPNGAFEWQPGSGANQLATQQAIPALLGRPQPMAVSQPEICPAAFLSIAATAE